MSKTGSMLLFYFAITLAVASSALYHFVAKSTPSNVNFTVSLLVTYGVAFVMTLLTFFFFPTKSVMGELKLLNWASIGLAIAVMGIAAAFAVYRTRQPEVAPPRTDPVAAVQTSKPAVLPAQTGAPQAADQPAVVASSETAPAASDAPKTEPAPGATGTAAASATAVAEVKPSAPSAAEPKGSKVGTLDEEMKKAVGSSESQPAPADESKPAAGGSAGALPDQPSQGNAQAAVRSVLPGARACVAGATETSSASVTFSSSGSVQSVSVGGWAAQNGKTGCVKSALQGAHVAPFAKPSFTVPVTIRP